MSALPAPETYPESYAASLYERHYAAVFRHCLKQLRRREDADDATQTTFVYALLSLRRGVVPQTELAWLYTIASNVCSSSRRAWTRRGALATAQDVDALHDVIPTPDRDVPVTADEFRDALSAMPDTQRRALLLREWRGLSYSEIADKLGLTQSATETLLFRARRTLACKLQEKAGAGFSIAAFLRSLFQSGAAKTIAVGLGATAIAATPSAERHVSPHVLAQPRASIASHRVAPSPTIAPLRRTPAPDVRRTKPVQQPPAVGTQATHVTDVAPPAEVPPANPTSTPPAPPSTQAEPRPEVAPPAASPQSTVPVPDVALPPLPSVEEVVPPLPSVQLPDVPLPTVSLPPLPLQIP
jgi:RNA polymerase sigma factor (sigma-70 family)